MKRQVVTCRVGSLFSFLKCVAFIACVAGFCYQFMSFVSQFCEHPTVITMSVRERKEFIQPAVTVCNSNPVKRSKYCEKYPDKCSVLSSMDFENFCGKWPQYCEGENITNILIPKSSIFGWELDRRDVEELAPQIEDIFLEDNDFEGPFFFETQTLTNHFHIPCFIYNFETPHLQVFERDRTKLVSFVLNMEEDELFDPTSYPLAILAVHFPFDTVDPEFEGIPLKVGSRYDVHVKLEEEHLLPFPFKTDCLDYENQWRMNGRVGPRSKQACLKDCRDTFNWACLNCSESISSDLEHRCPRMNALCNQKKSDALLKESESCQTKCKNECTKRKYSYRIQEWPLDKKGEAYRCKNIRGCSRNNCDKTRS